MVTRGIENPLVTIFYCMEWKTESHRKLVVPTVSVQNLPVALAHQAVVAVLLYSSAIVSCCLNG